MSSFTIKGPNGNRSIGPGHPVFIIAEMSGNHNQDINRAFKIIDAAADAGVDAIKCQAYTPDIITIDCDNEYFQVKVNDAWQGQILYQLYKQAYTPWEWQPKLKNYAESKGLIWFSTPFDPTAVDFLEGLNVPFYKVSSFETGWIDFLKKVGSTKKPVLISRGMTDDKKLGIAIKILKEAGAPQIAVLHCVSSYPAKPEQMNLATIPDIVKRFGVIAGLSDHSMDSTGLIVPLISVGLGASIIEKHFTLSRADGGPDANFSLEPQEMKQLVNSIREAEASIGQPTYAVGKKEGENLVFRPSIFVVKDIKKGDIFTKENIKVIRPGYGLNPGYFGEILGKTATVDIKRGTPLTRDSVKEGLNNNLNFCSATIQDSELLLVWRNDLVTRQNSFHQDAVDAENHLKWLKNVLANPKKVLWIILNDNQTPIGQIRFDIEGAQAEVSISIAPESRGFGYSTQAILLGTLNFLSIHKDVDKILARIKSFNLASRKAFERAGYEQENEENGLVSYRFLRQ